MIELGFNEKGEMIGKDDEELRPNLESTQIID